MRPQPSNIQLQHAIAELQATIKAVYPEAEFRVHDGEDPPGVYLDAYTTAENAFCVLDLVSDRLVDLSIAEGLAIHVVPLPKTKTADG